VDELDAWSAALAGAAGALWARVSRASRQRKKRPARAATGTRRLDDFIAFEGDRKRPDLCEEPYGSLPSASEEAVASAPFPCGSGATGSRPGRLPAGPANETGSSVNVSSSFSG